MKLPTRNEELLLLSVWRLQEDAYGLSVRDEMARILGRDVSVGAVYVPLERLARRGYLATREAAPTDERGGRRTRYYRLSEKGAAALSRIEDVRRRAWQGFTAADLREAAG
jgi:DNA-binding PadR family transcriptional regulator